MPLQAESRSLGIATAINVGFVFIEVIAGWYLNSIAILSDALHDLGDSLALLFAFLSVYYSQRKAPIHYTYGYKRLTLVAASVNVLILIAGSVMVVFFAIPRFQNPLALPSIPYLILAAFGFVANLVAFAIVHQGHDHNHRVAALHLLEDVLGWAAVFVGGILIHWFQWYWIDPLLAIAIALFILYNAIRQLRLLFREWLVAAPYKINVEELTRQLQQLLYPNRLLDFHLWSVAPDLWIYSLHIQIPASMQKEEQILLKRQVRDFLAQTTDYATLHVTIELDYPEESDHCHCHET